MLVHTHASEQRDEVELVRAATGQDNIAYLASLGLATDRLCVAHCVWVTEAEQHVLAERRVKVLHCPGSNLKLGSGLAPIAELRARGVSVSLGADGAACNNCSHVSETRNAPGNAQGPGALPRAGRRGRARGRLGAGQFGDIRVRRPEISDLIVVSTRGVPQTPPADF